MKIGKYELPRGYFTASLASLSLVGGAAIGMEQALTGHNDHPKPATHTPRPQETPHNTKEAPLTPSHGLIKIGCISLTENVQMEGSNLEKLKVCDFPYGSPPNQKDILPGYGIPQDCQDVFGNINWQDPACTAPLQN